MNSHLTYLVAQERAADLARGAERTRPANPERDSDATDGQRSRARRPLARLRILIAGNGRLRARRA